MILTVIFWYLAVSILGVLTFPLAYRLLPALVDRGYALSRTIGLLVWGYVFWLFASLRVIRNDLGGLVLTLGLVLALSLWSLRGILRTELIAWWQAQRRTVIVIEVLFLVAFVGWAFVRSANPEIAGTEKPMEMAFINAILNSPTFPPHDPWLSGYAISYYYFGYVLVAMLARLTATLGSVAFNLGIALVFALSAVGAYGVVYNLLERMNVDDRRIPNDQRQRIFVNRQNSFLAVLGPFFVLILSNLEGFLEILHSRGVFWVRDAAGQLSSSFWKWLDMQELSQPPALPFSWLPSRYLWWWRASRVLQDYDLVGNWKEIIDEFPFFSYLLADLHPHVLAMPFAFLAIGIALNYFLGGGSGSTRWLWMRIRVHPLSFIFTAMALGGLAFLNTWDFPIYLALFCGTYVLFRMKDENWRWGGAREGLKVTSEEVEKAEEVSYASSDSTRDLVKEFLVIGLALGVSGILIYLPFYLGFSSQVGGILPSLVYSTRGAHLWIMFGSLLLPIFGFLAYTWKQQKGNGSIRRGLVLTLGVSITLFAVSLLLGLAIANFPLIGDIYLDSLGARGLIGALFQQAFVRRFVNLGGWATLFVLLAVTLGLILTVREKRVRDKGIGESNKTMPMVREMEAAKNSSLIHSPLSLATLFTLLLILTGTLLVFVPEFLYLRDQFGWRMNTIFKFYYQAWLLWGIAAAFSTAVVMRELRGAGGFLFKVGLLTVVLYGLVYPVLSILNKTNNFQPANGFTLDGADFIKRQDANEMAAIQWLSSAPPGVVLESIGGSYSGYGRVSTFSGQPTVLGWPGHESQWRGGAREMGSRQSDVERIYSATDWDQTLDLLRQYNVRYVFVGNLERNAYRVNENKFRKYLFPIFQQGKVTIYELPQTLGGGESTSP